MVSAVWEHFDRDRSSETAKCRKCGRTLQASTKKHGNSHLWRHLRSNKCAGQAAQRRHASPTWLPPLYPEPYDELLARGLVFIQSGGDELAGAGDGHSPNYVRMPQAVSPPSKWFSQRKGERQVDRIKVMTPQETINTEAQVAPGGAAGVNPWCTSSAEPAVQQRCDPQEKAAVSTPHGYGASCADVRMPQAVSPSSQLPYVVGDDYDEEHFQYLQSILSPRSERLLSSDKIDFVSDTKNPTEAPKSQCPPGPGNISSTEENAMGRGLTVRLRPITVHLNPPLIQGRGAGSHVGRCPIEFPS